jgi:hypothetical protein
MAGRALGCTSSALPQATNRAIRLTGKARDKAWRNMMINLPRRTLGFFMLGIIILASIVKIENSSVQY